MSARQVRTPSTLHIRCGSDIREGLAAGGVEGAFLEYSDPVCQGPVPAGLSAEAFLELRAAFLSREYGLAASDARRRLRSEAEGLEQAGNYDRVLLWFEHDLYDQIILARLLHGFCGRPDLRGRIFLICIDRFHHREGFGIQRFVGLGQLTPQQLATLPETAVAITRELLDAGRVAWEAVTAPDPTGLDGLVRGASFPLPFMPAAIQRHLQEFPGTDRGLALTERLALEAFASGCATPAQAFGQVYRTEAAPWLGDLMFWPVVARLGRGPAPAVTPYADPHSPVRLTDVGRALLGGEADWVRLNGIDRWVGGVRLVGTDAAWRYDQSEGRVVRGG